MAEPKWVQDEILPLVKKYGAVPPPWLQIPDVHPYDICWRMGTGESYMMIFWAWWKEQKKKLDEAQRIEYFRQWPPPPQWLKWMMDAIWDLEPWESGDVDDFDYSPYFERTEALGFGSQKDFEDDEKKWLNEDGEGEEEEEEDEQDDDDDDDEDEDEKPMMERRRKTTGNNN